MTRPTTQAISPLTGRTIRLLTMQSPYRPAERPCVTILYTIAMLLDAVEGYS